MRFLINIYGKQDWRKIFKGFLIGLIGAMLTYTTGYVASLLKIDVPPQYYPVVMWFWTTITNAAHKALDGIKE